MDPLAMGSSYPDGGSLFAEVAVDDLIDRLGEVTGDAERVAVAPWTFDEIEPTTQAREDHPEEAGWSYLVAEDDPDRDAIIGGLEPLAARRGMAEPAQPLRFPTGVDRGDWIDDAYKGLGDGRPRYLLLAGDPTVLPFPLQVDLAAAGAMVGRICFDDVDAYGSYADKLERFGAGDPVPRLQATVVSTFGGPFDATAFSTRFLTPPVTALLKEKGYAVEQFTGKSATKANVVNALGAKQRALVFTATHGAGFTASGPGGIDPRAVNGAWGCAPPDEATRQNAWDWLHGSELPSGAVAPGGLVVQFACFSYGTTDETSYAAWLGNRNVIEVDLPFVAAIPQRLLADPDGPIGYVGHVDYALAHGFVDPYGAPPPSGVHPRAQPFLTMIAKSVAELTPLGYALRDLHGFAAGLASQIASTFDALTEQGVKATSLDAGAKNSLIDKVIRRNDAMHFLLFGDPAARVRIDA
jgi:hypothetical protein